MASGPFWRGATPKRETLSGLLGGRGFSLRVAVGLAADDPLSRPRKGELEEAEELQGPIAHPRECHTERGDRQPGRFGAARPSAQR